MALFGPFGYLPKKRVTRQQVLETTNEHPVLTDLPPWNPNEGMGQGFNILKMIEDHAPARIKEIEAELDNLNRKHAELSHEKMQLQKLIDAIK